MNQEIKNESWFVKHFSDMGSKFSNQLYPQLFG